MAEWIKCSEKLPKDDESVLVTIEIMDGSRFVEMGSFYKGDYLSDVADLSLCPKENYKPIAWQPLPKAYKADEREQIEYTSDNGYKGVLYGESSFAIYEVESGKCKLHTGFRIINTYDELVKHVEDFPRFIEWLGTSLDDLIDREGVEDEEEI